MADVGILDAKLGVILLFFIIIEVHYANLRDYFKHFL